MKNQSQKMKLKAKKVQPRKPEKRPIVKNKSSKIVERKAPVGFPIVGIGGSAGGLEAFELFLKNFPDKTGLAFVIIQHLDPTHKGMLSELLQRQTTMNVFLIEENMHVKVNSIYVIPSNQDLFIMHGVLHLVPPSEPRGMRLPIDHFFTSLAEDQKENSIAVILSGMGSDGSKGLRAIKEKNGSVFVQSPDSAKFSGMPQSAANTGLADVIAPVQELPARILAHIHHSPIQSMPHVLDEDQAKSSIEKVLTILRAQTGHNFKLYKKTTIYRRIERRIGILHIENIALYVRFLRENPNEVDMLFNDLLIGVTNFFRDPLAWKQLGSKFLPDLFASRSPLQTLRAWVPACSTGEEAYSLAMLFQESLDSVISEKSAQPFKLQIFATDLDTKAIDVARLGIYPDSISKDVTSERLKRFFVKTEHGYQVSKFIRQMIIFAPQNLSMDPPFTRLDVLSCRNVLIYFAPELQAKVLPIFYYSLNPDGILFLGNSETVGEFSDMFTPLDAKARIYRRLTGAFSKDKSVFPTLFDSARPGASVRPQKLPTNTQALADSLILRTYSPSAVMTNENGDILYVNGRTGKYLEAASGNANWNIFVMAREGLRYALTSGFQNAVRKKETVILNNIVIGTEGGTQKIEVTIQPIEGVSDLGGMVMIIFRDITAPSKIKLSDIAVQGSVKQEIKEMTQQLEFARQEVQSVREEMQTSQEELKSTNEELQSTNEELQSTNEELNTSKEEMQSMNEELQIVNSELEVKMGEIVMTNNDMKHLIDSSEIATLFLDATLRLRRFTSNTCKISKLIPGDLGRPISDIASALPYPELVHDALSVLETKIKKDRQIVLSDGNWFLIRIFPYFTTANIIDGVVINFIDFNDVKKLDGLFKKTNNQFRLDVILRDSREAIFVRDLDGRILAWNPAAVKMYGWSEADALMMNFRDMIPEGLREEAMTRTEQLRQGRIMELYHTQRITKEGSLVDVSVISTALVNEAGEIYAISTIERTQK